MPGTATVAIAAYASRGSITEKVCMVVFDHVDAHVASREKGVITIDITNPTKHSARVTLLAETQEMAARPLGQTAFIHWPKTTVPAGQTRRIRVKSGGVVALAQ